MALTETGIVLARRVLSIYGVIQMSLTIRTQPHRTRQIIEALRSLMRPAQLNRGCTSARLYSEVGDPECLNYLEEWNSEDDLERQLRSGHFARLVAIMETAAEPPTLKFNHVVDTNGLEFGARVCGHTVRDR